MTTLVILLAAACSVGVLIGVTVAGLAGRRRYNAGWHDGHACGVRDNAALTEVHIREAMRLVAGPFDPTHPIWSIPQHQAGATDDVR